MRTRLRTPLTALVLGGTLAILLPHVGHAQAIDDITQQASQHVLKAWSYLINMVGFVGGGALLLASVFGWYMHQKNPNAGRGLGLVLAGFVCAALLLSFPFLARTTSLSVFSGGVQATGDQKMMKFDQ